MNVKVCTWGRYNFLTAMQCRFPFLTDIQRYINAIQDEIQALNEIIKSFTIHLGEKMKQLVESGYFEGIF